MRRGDCQVYSRIYRFPRDALNAKTQVEFVLSVLLTTIQSELKLFCYSLIAFRKCRCHTR